ncbi:ATP-dependent dethiobiotin synthetase BioD 1 [Rahnella aquatilis]|nr:ATP-dependent dethiobiotin synthetase BioD 1 [Rahnella aquatilis]
MRLGCINHAVLTAQAIAQSGLHLAGWIANDVQETGKHHQAYMDTLTRMLPAPLLGEIPYLSAGTDVNLGQYLHLNRLTA